MTNTNFQIGQEVTFSNGSETIYTGLIVKIKDKTLVVIDDESGMELWKAGCSVGTEISFNQVKY